MTDREALLKKISTYQFAALDLQLYLDTQKDDTETIKKIISIKNWMSYYRSMYCIVF